ncbi:hypothetical protein [Kribbella caucasensis]|uniref:hypothetical protein n=1 Tax=Kribbella caucasensis TaxID=2512215 RepID=UPI001EDF8182|nr:hypothetical protein [Kribbella sp. VKM Ac-2527]
MEQPVQALQTAEAGCRSYANQNLAAAPTADALRAAARRPGVLAALDEIPRVVAYLHDGASKYREAAGWVGSLGSNAQARMAAMQLAEAARRCEEAADYLSLAPPKVRGWVEQMVSGIRTAEPAGGWIANRPDGTAGRTPPAEGRRDDDSSKPTSRKSGGTAGAGDDQTNKDGAAPGTQPVQPGAPDEPEPFGPVAREILERLPVRQPRDKTRGIWIDASGAEHDLLSGVDEYTADVDRFMEDHQIRIAPGRRYARLPRRDQVRDADA